MCEIALFLRFTFILSRFVRQLVTGLPGLVRLVQNLLQECIGMIPKPFDLNQRSQDIPHPLVERDILLPQ